LVVSDVKDLEKSSYLDYSDWLKIAQVTIFIAGA